MNKEKDQINDINKFQFFEMKWFFLIGIIFIINDCDGKILPDENGPLSEVQTAVGLEAIIPCDLTPGAVIPDITDKVQLVIWYKEGIVKPIYSFDARGKSLQQASHWADEDILKQKAKFYFDTNPPSLRIKNVQRDESGLYRCRVDFQRSPTKNWRINMTVLVPPTQLIILDTYGAIIKDDIVGPYNLGGNINITCLSSGGVPPPRVSWWREHALLDDTYQILPDGTVRNVLQIIDISREDLMKLYTCQASNGHVVAPLSSAVKLDVNLPPLYIRLQGLNHPLVAGVRTQITCSSAGARPPPQIIWTKGGIMIRGATQTTSSDGNLTISELVFIPVPEDNEKQIVCSVTIDLNLNLSRTDGKISNNNIENNLFFLKDSRILDVRHAPIVSLNLGAPLDPNNIMKGSDVYLECDIQSNPPVKKVEWYHNDQQLYSSRGVIISNQTLVLQGVSKTTHGQYFCRASNVQGTVSSNEVYLDVKYPPVCETESTIIRAALKQVVNITCAVDSNPMQNITYKWAFNNSLEVIEDLPKFSKLSNEFLLDTELEDNAFSAVKENRSHRRQSVSLTEDNIEPYYQMIYSNSAKHQQLPVSKVPQKQLLPLHNTKTAGRKDTQLFSNNHNAHRIPIENSYHYRVDSFMHFGTVSCVAINFIGQSQPCFYHITPAELPDPIKNCAAFNATANSMQILCKPGNDGGIHQDFHVEVYDELNRQILYNVSYPYPEFTIKRLPSDSVFVIRVTSYNLQGFSSKAFRIRAKTLSAPLLRTASSTAVLVQLTPLLGALVGVIATLTLGVLCVIMLVKFRTKWYKRSGTGHSTTITEPDKGSAEPLSRSMGSHSTLEDKNPDVVPQENIEDEYNLEEKAFDSLNLEAHRNLFTSATINSTNPRAQMSLPRFMKQHRELSLTTNPAYALYNSPQRVPNIQRSTFAAPSNLFSAESLSNSYSRIPSYSTSGYETRTSPVSPYSSSTCTMPLLGKQNLSSNLISTVNGAIKSISPSERLSPQPTTSLLLANNSGFLGNYDENS